MGGGQRRGEETNIPKYVNNILAQNLQLLFQVL